MTGSRTSRADDVVLLEALIANLQANAPLTAASRRLYADTLLRLIANDYPRARNRPSTRDRDEWIAVDYLVRTNKLNEDGDAAALDISQRAGKLGIKLPASRVKLIAAEYRDAVDTQPQHSAATLGADEAQRYAESMWRHVVGRAQAERAKSKARKVR